MTPHKPAAIAIARQMRHYGAGDLVKVLRGKDAGRTFQVHQSANDWVMLRGKLSREVMSKGNVEPVDGFTEEEMNQARRAAERMQGLGSLI